MAADSDPTPRTRLDRIDPLGATSASRPGEVATTPRVVPTVERARGSAINRYVVIDKLGAGGMGVVLAAYDPELDRKIALKLLKAGGDGTAASHGRARLQREAQAMAKLSHPNVIAVHDVGTIGDEVFVAMEFVPGESLSRWLKTPRPWREVVACLIQAGRGLAAAHAAGLVHRDFKPDNCMVGDDGRVRVLDFGLARAQERQDPVAEGTPQPPSRGLGESSNKLSEPLTMTGSVMGTPAYMAPEQHLGADTDARTDQFAFCIALHEGLYGVRPFAGESYRELAGNVLSGRVREAPEERAVPGWLHKVILRGLSVKAEERFPSMDALLDELSRDPAIRRRRIAAVVAAVALLAVGGLGLRALRGAADRRCRGAEEKLAGAWDPGRREAVHRALAATGVPWAEPTWTRLSAALDTYAGGWTGMWTEACKATHVRGEQSAEALDLRMSCLGGRLADLRALVEVLAHIDKTAVADAASIADHLRDLDECADVEALRARVRLPKEPARRAAVERLGGHLARARALSAAARHAEGIGVAGPIWAASRTLDYPPLEAEAAAVMADLVEGAGGVAGAEPILRTSFATALAAGDDGAALDAANELVYLTGYRMARADRGEMWAEVAEGLLRRVGGKRREATLRGNVGAMYAAAGRNEEAAAAHRRALALNEEAEGPSSFGVAVSLNNLGAVLSMLGSTNEGLAMHQRSLAITEKLVGPDHPHTAVALDMVGMDLAAAGKYDDALPYFERALSVRQRALGAEHHDIALSLDNIGRIKRRKGDLAGALEDHQRALAIWEKVLGPDHPDVGVSLLNIGYTLMADRKAHDALVFFRRALALFEKSGGPDQPYVAYALAAIGQASVSAGAPAEAVAPLERMLALHALAELPGTMAAESRFMLARALWDSGGDRQRAVAQARQAREEYVAGGERYRPDVAEVETWLALHGGAR